MDPRIGRLSGENLPDDFCGFLPGEWERRYDDDEYDREVEPPTGYGEFLMDLAADLARRERVG